MSKSPLIVAFEGNFATGKTTLMNLLQQSYGIDECKIFVDPEYRWYNFHSDQKCRDQILRWGRTLDSYDLMRDFLETPSFDAFDMLLEQLTNAARNLSLAAKEVDKRFVLVERTPMSVLDCFGSVYGHYLNGKQKQMLDRVKDAMDDVSAQPDMRFILSARPSQLMPRIQERGPTWEKNVSENLLHSLDVRFNNLKSVLQEGGSMDVIGIETGLQDPNSCMDCIASYIDGAWIRKSGKNFEQYRYCGSNSDHDCDDVICLDDSTSTICYPK